MNTATREPSTTDRTSGVTLMHEHVFVLDHEIEHNYPGRWDEEGERMADALVKLRDLT